MSEHKVDYSKYKHLTVKKQKDGIAIVTLNRPETLNSANILLHWEMGQIWRDIDIDPEVRALCALRVC